MSHYNKPTANLIQTPSFQDAIQKKLDEGWKLYQVESHCHEGNSVAYQILINKEPLEEWNDISAQSKTLYYDKYHRKPHGTLQTSATPIRDIAEVHTAMLYKVD